mgnify:CR=1 FL=1
MKTKPPRPLGRAITIDMPLPGGGSCRYIGREVRRDADRIVLVEAAWVAHTGRMSDFLAGVLDGACEVEPHPPTMEVELPLTGAVIADWPGTLPAVKR